ncbi:MAG: terpene cyclase/mutase family protein [Planctomycetota bacterium]|nr:terpene cyclase/mutase family protein [Planctomycetota bacterium]
MKQIRLLAAATLLLSLVGLSPAQERPTQERQPDEPRRSALDESVIVVTPEHSRAVERGLEWLAANQVTAGTERGAWIAQIGYKLNTGYKYTSADKGHVGVTAMAGMAFLAGGHLPGRGKYGRNVEDALEFVLKAVQADGYITHAGSRMYSHAFATLFLAEVYGQTHRQDIRSKLQLAVDFIVHSQNADGGWRYEPYAQESDMSIVVCQVMALRAARNIGIRVPKSTIDMAAKYVVDSAVTEETLTRSFGGGFNMRNEVGSFHYQKNDGSRSSFPLTAAGVTALYGAGVYSDQSIDDGIRYLRSRLAQFNFENGRNAGGHYFFWYGHYYGVQAMYTAGADDWESYFATVRDEILRMQNTDGSWPNAVGPGPALGTAAAVLILEIPYRYLPIFQR